LHKQLIAGGGGGGAGRYGLEDGGGGMVLEACGIPVCGATGYPIVIGGGGPSSGPTKGTDSTGFGLTAKGGGGGRPG
jgi:hypothetical protein